jgi:hypothetical protein
MKTVVKHFILTLILVASPSAAMAQRLPATDSGASGGDGGLFMGRLSARPTLEGFYEYYFRPRNSLRIGVGWARPEVDQQYLRVPVDVVYNWERGSVHPFGGAGLGIYFLQDKFWDGEITRETKLGGTLFGGIELYAKPRTASFKIEARYHAVRNTIGNPDGLAISLGFKKYF